MLLLQWKLRWIFLFVALKSYIVTLFERTLLGMNIRLQAKRCRPHIFWPSASIDLDEIFAVS